MTLFRRLVELSGWAPVLVLLALLAYFVSDPDGPPLLIVTALTVGPAVVILGVGSLALALRDPERCELTHCPDAGPYAGRCYDHRKGLS